MLKFLENWYRVQKKKKSFWAKFSAVMIGLLIAGLFAIKFYFYKDQVAVLKTKQALADDDKKDLEYEHKQATVSVERVEALEKIEETSKKIDQVQESIKAVDNSRQEDHDIIESLESWEDVDKKIH